MARKLDHSALSELAHPQHDVRSMSHFHVVHQASYCANGPGLVAVYKRAGALLHDRAAMRTPDQDRMVESYNQFLSDPPSIHQALING